MNRHFTIFLCLFLTVILTSCSLFLPYKETNKKLNNSFTVYTNVSGAQISLLNKPKKENFTSANNLSTTGEYFAENTFFKLKKSRMELLISKPNYDSDTIVIKRSPRTGILVADIIYFPFLPFDLMSSKFYKISKKSKVHHIQLDYSQEFMKSKYLEIIKSPNIEVLHKYLLDFPNSSMKDLVVSSIDSINLINTRVSERFEIVISSRSNLELFGFKNEIIESGNNSCAISPYVMSSYLDKLVIQSYKNAKENNDIKQFLEIRNEFVLNSPTAYSLLSTEAKQVLEQNQIEIDNYIISQLDANDAGNSTIKLIKSVISEYGNPKYQSLSVSRKINGILISEISKRNDELSQSEHINSLKLELSSILQFDESRMQYQSDLPSKNILVSSEYRVLNQKKVISESESKLRESEWRAINHENDWGRKNFSEYSLSLQKEIEKEKKDLKRLEEIVNNDQRALTFFSSTKKNANNSFLLNLLVGLSPEFDGQVKLFNQKLSSIIIEEFQMGIQIDSSESENYSKLQDLMVRSNVEEIAIENGKIKQINGFDNDNLIFSVILRGSEALVYTYSKNMKSFELSELPKVVEQIDLYYPNRYFERTSIRESKIPFEKERQEHLKIEFQNGVNQLVKNWEVRKENAYNSEYLVVAQIRLVQLYDEMAYFLKYDETLIPGITPVKSISERSLEIISYFERAIKEQFDEKFRQASQAESEEDENSETTNFCYEDNYSIEKYELKLSDFSSGEGKVVFNRYRRGVLEKTITGYWKEQYVGFGDATNVVIDWDGANAALGQTKYFIRKYGSGGWQDLQSGDFEEKKTWTYCNN